MSDVISHWLDGKPFAGTSGNTAPVTNPATGAVTGRRVRDRSGVAAGTGKRLAVEPMRDDVRHR